MEGKQQRQGGEKQGPRWGEGASQRGPICRRCTLQSFGWYSYQSVRCKAICVSATRAGDLKLKWLLRDEVVEAGVLEGRESIVA